jgi:WD40 repeat protein
VTFRRRGDTTLKALTTSYQGGGGGDIILTVTVMWLNTVGVGQVWTTSLHKRILWSIAFSPDGHRVVSGSDNGTPQIWAAATGAEVRTPGSVFRFWDHCLVWFSTEDKAMMQSDGSLFRRCAS